jgi:hypothetical protein
VKVSSTGLTNFLGKSMNAELMVIGDSLAQGVQSMTFRPDFAAQCIGARLAALQGWAFNIQSHPRPVLFDIEAEVRQISTLEILEAPLFFKDLLQGLCDRINGNLEQWMQDLVDTTTVLNVDPFDNLAVGGAIVSDLFQPASFWRQTLKTNRAFKLSVDGILNQGQLSQVMTLFKAINYSYILNPGRDPALENYCVMDWVKTRAPKRLLVTIGHNDGGDSALWNVGFDATNCQIDTRQWARLGDLVNSLASLNGQWVCWDLLPKISAVANLEPVGTKWTGSGLGKGDNYCDIYQPVVGANSNHLAGGDLQKIDASVLAANQVVQTQLTAAFTSAGKLGQLRFFNDYAFFQSIDFKNQPNYDLPASQAIRVEFPFQSWDQYVDNRYVYADYRPQPNAQPQGRVVPEAKRVVAGGLQSLDGMHPTGIGYMLKAIALSNQKDLGLIPIANSDGWLSLAFKENTLTDDFPTITNTLRLILRGIQNVSTLAPAANAVPQTRSTSEINAQYANAWVQLVSATACNR